MGQGWGTLGSFVTAQKGWQRHTHSLSSSNRHDVGKGGGWGGVSGVRGQLGSVSTYAS